MAQGFTVNVVLTPSPCIVKPKVEPINIPVEGTDFTFFGAAKAQMLENISTAMAIVFI